MLVFFVGSSGPGLSTAVVSQFFIAPFDRLRTNAYGGGVYGNGTMTKA